MPPDGQHPGRGGLTDAGPAAAPVASAAPLAAVGETLRRPAPPPDPLTGWRRRMLQSLVGWLAAQFEAAARRGGDEAAGRYAGYAALLRRIDGDMTLAARPPAARGRRRGHLTVVDGD